MRQNIYALCAAAAVVLGSTQLHAQLVISAKSGVINYYEGDVKAGGAAVESKNGKFPEWQKDQELVTTEGRAEVLLTPGVFLRLAENTTASMADNRLSDTRVRLMNGSVLLECAELLEGNAVTLLYKDYAFTVRKAGLYRLDSETGTIRVFEGEMLVAGGGQTLTLKKGKMAQLGGVLVASKFDQKQNDAFYRWASRRAEPLSVASFSSARSIYSGGQMWNYGGWAYNPYFGFYTYVPYRGFYNSPFGYQFYSPVVITNLYNNLAYANAYRQSQAIQNRESAFSAGREAMTSRGEMMRGGFDNGGAFGANGGYSGRGGMINSSSSMGVGTGSTGISAGGGAPSRGDIGGGGGGGAAVGGGGGGGGSRGGGSGR